MKDFTQYKLLAMPNPKDERNYKLSRIIPTAPVLPESYEIPYHGVVKDQGSVNACVAHSLSYVKEIMEEKQSNEFKYFSVGFIYANRESTDYQGGGLIIGQALKNLKKYGDCLQSDFPINQEYPAILSTLNSYGKDQLLVKAYPYHISSYYELLSIDEIKTALYTIGPVTICIPVYDSFYNTPVNNDTIPIPNTLTEKLQGYHEMTITGWTTDNKFIVLNSWGADWANNGYCYLSFTFFTTDNTSLPYYSGAYAVTDNIIPNTKVIANFDIISDENYTINKKIEIINKSYDASGNALTCDWGIYNGQLTATGGILTFTTAGTYTIYLNVTNSLGMVASVQKKIIITETPVVNFYVNGTYTNIPVEFLIKQEDLKKRIKMKLYEENGLVSSTVLQHRRPYVTISTPGEYSFILEVTDKNGYCMKLRRKIILQNDPSMYMDFNIISSGYTNEPIKFLIMVEDFTEKKVTINIYEKNNKKSIDQLNYIQPIIISTTGEYTFVLDVGNSAGKNVKIERTITLIDRI